METMELIFWLPQTAFETNKESGPHLLGTSPKGETWHSTLCRMNVLGTVLGKSWIPALLVHNESVNSNKSSELRFKSLWWNSTHTPPGCDTLLSVTQSLSHFCLQGGLYIFQVFSFSPQRNRAVALGLIFIQWILYLFLVGSIWNLFHLLKLKQFKGELPLRLFWTPRAISRALKGRTGSLAICKITSPESWNEKKKN